MSTALGEQVGQGVFVGEQDVKVGVAGAGFKHGAHYSAKFIVIVAENVAEFVEHDREPVDTAVGFAWQPEQLVTVHWLKFRLPEFALAT